MAQKVLIGLLVLGIALVVGIGLNDAAQLATSDTTPAANIQEGLSIRAQGTPVHAPGTGEGQGTPQGTPQVAAQGAIGEAWTATGTITKLDDFGMDLTTDAGKIYVELGPPTYWQTQDMTLAIGDVVLVEGYSNGEQVHARIVHKAEEQLIIRTEAGQPMWAGGVTNGGAGGAAATSAEHTAGSNFVQIAPEEWVTLNGTLTSVANGQVSFAGSDNQVIALQMGQPNFWQSQGVTLNVGDPVQILGYWSGAQFMPGEIRKTATGETIMLRDPNGRQLWGGPGRNGNSNGNSNANGNNNANNTNNGYRGGRS